MNTTIFTVTGRGQFPTDMLRYDQCYPFGPDDAVNLYLAPCDDGLHYVNDAQAAGRSTTRQVTLVHVSDRRHWAPTKDRWASFGWVVCRVNDVDIDGEASWYRAVYGEAAHNFLDEFCFEVWLGTGTGYAERSVARVKASSAEEADRELRKLYGDTLEDWTLID
ncbi:MAG: hypothetical protein AMS21_02120 [Gemmatimonas sp. SG8_38_2]|nr:MAG: hypothetical protein AMS21_02120 [Gemmatimonas sp. SG8_38_2]